MVRTDSHYSVAFSVRFNMQAFTAFLCSVYITILLHLFMVGCRALFSLIAPTQWITLVILILFIAIGRAVCTKLACF